VSVPTPLPAPGWYPDPAGTSRRRWWDGRAWTDYFADGGWDGVIAQPPLPAGARVNTVWIWLYVFLPVLSIALSLVLDQAGAARRAAEVATRSDGVVVVQSGVQLGAQGIGLLLYGVGVLLAALDWRALARVGVVRPFHWAFAFIPAPVYIIGRTVVLRRRVRRGMAPLWAWIAVTLASIVVTVVLITMIMSAILPGLLSSSAP
jgi:hypothetical protein